MSDRLAEIRHRLEAHVYPDVMEPEIRFLLARLAACERERDDQARKHFEWHERADDLTVRLAAAEEALRQIEAAGYLLPNEKNTARAYFAS